MGRKSSYVPDLETSGRMGQWLEPYPPPPPPPQEWVPWLMPLMALVLSFAFAFTMFVNDCPSSKDHDATDCVFYPSLGRFSFEPFFVNPLLGPTAETLDKLGALDYKKIVMDGERWRLVSCMWLHAGVVHLLANLFSLLFTGIRLEEEFGFVKIGLLYFLSGLGGSLVSCVSNKLSISVGVSGALFGLLGAMLSELITNWTIYSNKCTALFTLLLVIGINMAVGAVPHVDSSAHIGGFVSGFLLGFVLLMRPQYGYISRKHIPPGYNMGLIRPKFKIYQLLLCLTSLVLLVIGFGYGFTKLKLLNMDQQQIWLLN
ncbi:RHOMBOID-like protein 5 [Zingiber officinale]|nr:RHOMBOID-like protein 5 [Zingiber officinale]